MNKETKQSLSQLSRENRKAVREIAHYIEARSINEVVLDDLISDLVGMALESQTRGIPFSETVGMDFHEFARQMVKNAPKQSLWERLLDLLKCLLWCVGITLPILWIISLFGFFRATECVRIFTLIAPVSFLLKYMVLSSVLVCGWFLTRRFSFTSRSLVVSVYLGGIVLLYIVSDILAAHFLNSITFSVNMLVWCGIFLVLLLLSSIGKRLVAFTFAYAACFRAKK